MGLPSPQDRDRMIVGQYRQLVASRHGPHLVAGSMSHSRGVPRQRARHARAGGGPASARCARSARGAARRPPATSIARPASSRRASASRCCSTPAAPFLEFSPLAAHGLYGGDIAVRGHHHRHRPRRRARVRDRRQRPDRQGRHLLPAHGEEAPARAGDRRARTACRACTWSRAAARSCPPRTRCFRTASTSAASSTTRRRSRRRASRRSRWCTAPAPPAAPTCRPCPMRTSSCATRAACSSAARRW